jgi:hypothetical protein
METVIATKADALILDLEASARTELKARMACNANAARVRADQPQVAPV